MHDDGFGGGIPQPRVQAGGYPPPSQAPAGHVSMAGPRNQGLQFLLLFQLCGFVGTYSTFWCNYCIYKIFLTLFKN